MHHLSLGIIFMFIASFFFAIMNAFIKVLSQTISPVENLFFRSIIMTFFMLLVLTIQKKSIVKKSGGWYKLFFRAIIGGLSMLALFYNISTIPLSVATTFAQSTPLYVLLFSLLFLKEKIPLTIIAAGIIGFIGIIFICNPFGESLASINIAMGILSGGGAALALITLRSLKEYFENSFIILFFGLSMSIIGGIIILLPVFFIDNSWHTPNFFEWCIIILMGLSGTVGQHFLTKAYMAAPAGIVAPIDYIKILWGILMGAYLGDSFPNIETWSGILLILFSGILIALPIFIKDYKRVKNGL